MYKIGMYGGCFNPLHNGHVNAIIEASTRCEKLYVVMSNSKDKNEINHRERLMWLKTVTKDIDNIEVFEIFDENDNKYEYDWENGVKQVKDYIKENIDVIFAGDDYKGTNTWENAYPESKVEYLKRDGISSTLIRSDVYKYFDYLPKIVQNYYLKKVCIIGTESCGKTTLVRKLAKMYNTTHVEEMGRYVCEEAGGIDNMQKKHYIDILSRHKVSEQEAIKHANKLLFVDTDSLITLYYYILDFGIKTKKDKNFKKLAESIAALNNYDLYLFLEPDVKWVQDGSRTYGEDSVRQNNNKILKKLLEDNKIKYISISGTYNERLKKATKEINKLFQ